jgi:hypothetical protein
MFAHDSLDMGDRVCLFALCRFSDLTLKISQLGLEFLNCRHVVLSMLNGRSSKTATAILETFHYISLYAINGRSARYLNGLLEWAEGIPAAFSQLDWHTETQVIKH